MKTVKQILEANSNGGKRPSKGKPVGIVKQLINHCNKTCKHITLQWEFEKDTYNQNTEEYTAWGELFVEEKEGYTGTESMGYFKSDSYTVFQWRGAWSQMIKDGAGFNLSSAKKFINQLDADMLVMYNKEGVELGEEAVNSTGPAIANPETNMKKKPLKRNEDDNDCGCEECDCK